MEKRRKKRNDNHVRHKEPLVLTAGVQDGSASDSADTKLKCASIHIPVKHVEAQTLLAVSLTKT